MNKKLFILSLVMFLCAVQTSNVIAWENEFTHPALTEKTVERSDLDDYLKTQLEMPDGIETELYWDFSFYLHVKEPIEAGETDPSKTARIYGVLEISKS
jgi:hypothetical protein